MWEQKKKVLIQVRDLRIGNGIASCIMNYFEYTATHGYSIDFLLNRNIASPYVDLVEKYGSKIYVLPHDTGKPDKENRKYIRRVVTAEYDIFHANISGLNALEGLRIAKKAGIAIRIYHAHNPKEISSIKAKIRSLIYETPSVLLANQYVACSHYAGDSIFGNRKYTVLTNAMDTSRFSYDQVARERLRKELDIQDKFVVGVVGRLAEQKNPYFILDVFSEFKKKENNSVLIWVGDGDLRSSIEDYINEKKLDDSVKLLGTRTDVNKLYSAMDVFLLPSKFEGLGLVFIEAQISGLECFGSDHVPVDVEITEKMHRIKLKEPAMKWASIMNESRNNSAPRKDYKEEALSAGYEIKNEASSLLKIYTEFLEN